MVKEMVWKNIYDLLIKSYMGFKRCVALSEPVKPDLNMHEDGHECHM